MKYTIKPLVWMEDGDDRWSARWEFDEYGVWMGPQGSWRWIGKGIHSRSCSSLAEGKAAAEANYRERLEQCLEPHP